MALGLNKVRVQKNNTIYSSGSGITLRMLISNTVGFPMNYLPSVRKVEGVDYIHTVSKGRDSDNSTVFYKWLFIDPTQMDTTPDSESEYARIPESGYLMRIVQRSMLPYHENFTIDYYEDINNMRVINIPDDDRNTFQNKIRNVTRIFPTGDMAVPSDLKQEIYNYPEAFFKKYIESAVPMNLLYTKRIRESNNMSDYMEFQGVNRGYENPFNISPVRRTPANARPAQSPINVVQPKYPSFIKSTGKPPTIDQTGLHYKIN